MAQCTLITKKAQVTLEYAMVAICIVAALLTMQYYIKRAAQGRFHEAADSIGGQYDPSRIANSEITFIQSGTTTTTSLQVREDYLRAEENRVDGIRTTVNTQGEVTERTGNEELGAFSANLFN